jgi:hypothetical protein
MKKISMLILIAGLLLLSGCINPGPSCPSCPEPSSYSECNDQAIKTRTNYRCSEATDFQCESYIEEKQCVTEITLTGNIDGTVKPSIEEKVKGIIKIEVRNVPDDTVLIAYFLEGGDLSPIGLERMPYFASNQGDVWTGMIDTNKYKNGLYEIGVVSNNKEELEGNPQAYAQGQIIISN